MIKELCISIVGSLSQHAHIPQHVHTLVSNEVGQLFEKTFKKSVKWNEKGCQEEVNYYYGSDKIFIEGALENFTGRYESSVHQALEKQLPPLQTLLILPESTAVAVKKNKKKKRWLPWLIGAAAGVAIGAGVYYYKSKNRRRPESGPPSEEQPAPQQPTSTGQGPQPVSF